MSFDFKIQNGDLQLKNGDLSTVTAVDKLKQDILKICLTEAGSNPLAPGYGSYISKSLVGSALDNNIFVTIAQSQLQNSLDLLKNLQEQQLKSQQNMSPDEQIAAISEISVTRNPNDFRLYDIRIKVVTKGFIQADTSFSLI